MLTEIKPLPCDDPSMATVQVLTQFDELPSCQLLWNALLPQTPGASFFQSWDWLNVYWKHFGAGQQLRILVVSSAGQTIGILPLVIRTEATRVGPIRVLTYPLDDWGTFYGPIGPHPTATLVAALGYLKRQRPEWDLFELRWVDRALDRERTATALRTQAIPATASIWAEAAWIDLAGTWDAYWASRTSRWRNNVRRNEKKLAKLGRLEYLRYRPLGSLADDDDPRWDLYQMCEDLALASWQGSSQTGTTLSHGAIRDYLRETHEAAARQGALDLNLLLLNDEPIAFNYAYHYQGYVYGLRTGKSRSAAADGGGSVLQQRMIEDSFRRGDRLYDLGAEYAECKRYWLTELHPSYRYSSYVTPRTQLLRFKRWLSSLRRTAG